MFKIETLLEVDFHTHHGFQLTLQDPSTNSQIRMEIGTNLSEEIMKKWFKDIYAQGKGWWGTNIWKKQDLLNQIKERFKASRKVTLVIE